MGIPSELNIGSLDRLRDAPLGVCSDEFLARRAARGDNRAFALIYKRHEDGLYKYCRSLVGTADADDALQSAMWLALRALGNGTRPLAVKPWLFRIVHNESMSLLRRRRPDVELSDDHEHPSLSPSHASPHAEVSSRATVRRLFADLKELTDQQRAVLIMRELNDFKADDIAQALGISSQGVRQSLYEARRSLQDFEEGRLLECEFVQEQIESGDRRKLGSRKLLAHLRDCQACEGFKSAVAEPQRSARLAAFAPIALPGAFTSWFGSLFGGGSATVATAGAGASGGLTVAGSTAAGVVGAKGLAIAAAAVLAAGVGTRAIQDQGGTQKVPVAKQQATLVEAPAGAAAPAAFDPLAAPRRQIEHARDIAQRRAERRRAAAERRAVAKRRARQRAARAPARTLVENSTPHQMPATAQPREQKRRAAAERGRSRAKRAPEQPKKAPAEAPTTPAPAEPQGGEPKTTPESPAPAAPKAAPEPAPAPAQKPVPGGTSEVNAN